MGGQLKTKLQFHWPSLGFFIYSVSGFCYSDIKNINEITFQAFKLVRNYDSTPTDRHDHIHDFFFNQISIKT